MHTQKRSGATANLQTARRNRASIGVLGATGQFGLSGRVRHPARLATDRKPDADEGSGLSWGKRVESARWGIRHETPSRSETARRAHRRLETSGYTRSEAPSTGLTTESSSTPEQIGCMKRGVLQAHRWAFGSMKPEVVSRRRQSRDERGSRLVLPPFHLKRILPQLQPILGLPSPDPQLSPA